MPRRRRLYGNMRQALLGPIVHAWARQKACRAFFEASLDDVVLQKGFGCDATIVQDLWRACQEHRRLRIVHDRGAGPQEWVIDPYQIFFKRRVLTETRWHSSQQVEDLPDGRFMFQVDVGEPREVGWWAMQRGASAEVVEPESLRREMAETARELVEVYETCDEERTR